MSKVKAVIAMTAGLLFVGLTTFAQSISFKVKDVSVKRAIIELKEKTGYSIVFATGDIDTSRQVSVNATDLKQAIQQILVGQDVSFSIQGKTVAISQNKPAAAASTKQDIASGTLLDAKGEAVIGAGVMIRGSKRGVISDINGHFSMDDVPVGTILDISCIGYTATAVVWRGVPLNIVLEDDTLALDEVVVIGYGTMRKSDLTGSVEKADISSVKTAPNSNILQAMQGSVAGLQISQTNTAGAEPSIGIRGQITINGNTDPLIVVDGIIYNGAISDLNPSDIEAIDILKDASSKAVYGAKAANGVMIITTKGGAHESAPRITYSGNWSWSNPTQSYRPLNREQWLTKARDIDYKNAYTEDSGYMVANPDWSYTSTGMNDVLYAGIEANTEYDWWGNATQTGHLHTNTVDVSGGSDIVSYFISGGFTDQAGVIKNDAYSRATLRTNLDVRVTPWLKIGTNTFLAFLDYSGDCPSIGTIARMPTVVAPKDDDGNWISNPTGSNLINPFLAAESVDSNKRHQINSTIYALVDIPGIKGLTYRLNYNFTKSVLDYNNFNQYEASLKGEASKQHSSQDYWLLDNILNYSQSFVGHNINATFVYGVNKTMYDYTKALGQQFANPSLGYNDISQAVIQRVYSDAWSEANLYQMFRVAYNYNGKYIFTGTLRRDGFSGFAENHKFGFFPSLGVGWTISKEPWMQKMRFIDNLKLRASYGVTGNQASRYSSLAKVGVSDGYVYGDGGATAISTYVSSMGNSNLKWETTSEFNIGMDFALFANRIHGSVDYYNSSTKDLFWNVALPSMTGFASVKSNVGKLHNSGVEITIGGNVIKTRDFLWNVNVNFSADRNRIVSLLGEDSNGDGKEDDLVSSGLFIGQSLGSIYDYQIEGIWSLEDEAAGLIPKGFYPGTYKIKDQDGDGAITPANDRIILGHKDPDFRIGIRNSLSFKGFDLNFFFNIINGGRNGYLAYNKKANFVGNSPGNATNQNWMNCYDYWSPSNSNAKFATAWSAPAIDVDIVESRSFARLQDISLGYTFSDKMLRHLKMDALRLYLSGKNLLTFSSWDGWDPEMAIGVCSTAYPVMRSYAFGVEITF